MERKQKEAKVKRIHPNVISAPTETCKTYRTRASWVPSGRLTNASYDKLIDELYNHYFRVLEAPTFEECFNEWVNKRESNGTIEYLTATHYRCDFKKYIAGTSIAKMKVNKITKSQIIDFFENLAGDGSNITKKAFSGVKTIFNGTLNYANLIDDLNCINPRDLCLSDIKKKCYKKDNSSEVYSEDDIEKLLEYLHNIEPTTYSLAVQLVCCLSVRISEITALTWSDVDFNNKTIKLHHTIVTKKIDGYNRKRVDVPYMKKHSEASKRILDLSEYALWTLHSLYKITGSKKYVLNSNGELPISTNNFNSHLKKYCEAAGITYRSSHKIRFYACSKMYSEGIDERIIQFYMGHSSLEMTRHYDRRIPKKLDENAVNKAFGHQLPKIAQF